ncbi:MAG: dihydroorotate dehydrogenase electron transfer subunit [Syntrophales bacterium]|nr:dihydroorotate dehydrogenase electron transfer subunit [Syntrophales bacterium]
MKPETCAKIFSQRETVKGHFLMIVKAPVSFREAIPGQFIMVRLEGGNSPFLSRPFSIYSIYSRGDDTFVEIFYKVVGKGTDAFSRLREGASLDILGPLGRGFDVPASCRKVALVAGGIGVAPLSFLAQRCGEDIPGTEVICYLGAGSSEALAGLDRLEKICSTVEISTDDGSRGYHGSVTGLLKRDMDLYADDDTRIYSCGPRPMLRGLQELLKGRPPGTCQVSLEERMACGIGACLGCVARIRSDGEKGGMVRVCKEGPVFDIDRVEFGE